MKERPLIMGAASVRAILNGTKTQTRRVVRHQWPAADCHPKEHSAQPGVWIAYTDDGRLRNADGDRRCPYGVVGDRLWVREAFGIVPWTAYARSEGVQQTRKPDPAQPNGYDIHDAAIYKAGWDRGGSTSWRSPLHMPRWASRLTLAITAIRAQRLQDIREADAIAEGLVCETDHIGPRYGPRPGEMTNRTAMAAYLRHWNTLNEKRGYPWQANPWVWCISFERVGEVADGPQ